MASSPALTPVTLLTSDMAVPAIALDVLPYGLHITKILLNANGQSNDVMIAPYSPEELTKGRMMLNCIVGRYTNRLPAGPQEIKKGEAKAILNPIANISRPNVSLHGGPEGFDRKNWARIQPHESRNFSDVEKGHLARLDEESVAIFSLTSPDGDEGFPGTLYTEVLFAILPLPDQKIRPESGEIELGSLVIVYRARLLSGTFTPINLTQHWGFNFSASLQPSAGEPNANKHWMRIDSSRRLEVDAGLMPTGGWVEDPKGGPWDWKKGKIVGKEPARYDGYLLFDRKRGAVQAIHVPIREWETEDLLGEVLDDRKDGVDVPVELYEEESGVRAKFQTNQPGVQIYGGEGLNGFGTKKKIHGGTPTGPGYTGRPAVYLEFQEPVAAMFHPYGHEEDGADTLLGEGEMYNHYVKVAFSYKPKP